VEIRTDEVLALIYSENDANVVAGVRLAGGETVYADLVVVAAGAWSTKLVDLRGRTEATGQVATYYDLTEDEQTELEKRPIVMNFSTGLYVIPPLDRVLKIGRNGYGYRNPSKISDPSGTGENIVVSLPAQNNEVPAEGRVATRQYLGNILPSLAYREMKTSRVCWYTDTQEGNFIVDYHPRISGLFIATGGSGHAFKFFPVIGEKVADAIHGVLNPELQKLWAWPKDALPKFSWELRPDGSRGGPADMILEEERKKSSPIPLKWMI